MTMWGFNDIVVGAWHAVPFSLQSVRNDGIIIYSTEYLILHHTISWRCNAMAAKKYESNSISINFKKSTKFKILLVCFVADQKWCRFNFCHTEF